MACAVGLAQRLSYYLWVDVRHQRNGIKGEITLPKKRLVAARKDEVSIKLVPLITDGFLQKQLEVEHSEGQANPGSGSID